MARTNLVALVTVLFALASADVAADVPCSFSISVVDGATRESKTYVPGDAPFSIPFEASHGWDRCRVTHVKKFQLKGLSGRIGDAQRVDLFCFSKEGQVVNNSLVVQADFPVEVLIFTLLSRPVSFKGKGDDESIDTSNSKEITVLCGAR